MAPYTPFNPNQYNLGLRRKNLNKEKNRKLRSIEVMPGVFEPAAYDKFLTLSLEEGNIEDSDIFEIYREIITCLGRKPKISSLGKGHLLIEVQSPSESSKLKEIETVCGNKIKCEPHKTYNQSRGVIFSKALMKFSEEKLLKELKDQNVTEVKRIMKKEHGESHGPCSNAPKCVNCGGEHPASDKKCERYRFEKEIMAVKTKERISFFEAKQKVASSFNPGIRTFASVTKRREMEKNSSNNNSNPRTQLNKRSRSDDCIILPDSKSLKSRGDSFKTISDPLSSQEEQSSSTLDGPLTPSPTSTLELPMAALPYTSEELLATPLLLPGDSNKNIPPKTEEPAAPLSGDPIKSPPPTTEEPAAPPSNSCSPCHFKDWAPPLKIIIYGKGLVNKR
ncbi:uncharacterized protein LOC135226649 [Macrobrachium nipponense]|uniref:uncharacterized protein LOC135226649 n=1 Tax=Macrobrachium nipponense TaxID=159736 RepID=UPI0030C86FE3